MNLWIVVFIAGAVAFSLFWLLFLWEEDNVKRSYDYDEYFRKYFNDPGDHEHSLPTYQVMDEMKDLWPDDLEVWE